MPNNANIYNAALGGAATGVSSRAIISADPTFYDAQSALVAQFADAFDGQIAPIVGGGSRGQCDVITDICAAYWRDRIITSQGNLTAAAQALAALFQSLDPYIQPDSGGGGSGATYAAATNTIAIPDDGNFHDILTLSFPANETTICVVGILITPDNPADEPSGTIRIEDPAATTSDLDWGPILPGETLYQTFSAPGITLGDYILKASVVAASGPCTATLASMVLVQVT